MLDSIQLGNFAVDLEQQRLVHLGEPISLRPKTWLVLRYMARRLGTFVSTEELHQSAWPGLAVTPQTLTNVISELRKVSRLDANASLRIETRYGEGYRLVVDQPTPSPVSTLAATKDAARDVESSLPRTTAVAADSLPDTPTEKTFVGRKRELDQLLSLSARALNGQRQVVFVGGTAGMGKTTLINQFVRRLALGNREDRRLGVRRLGVTGQLCSPNPEHLNPVTPFLLSTGRCLARHGEAEAYAPLLDALEEVSREVDLVADLRRCAPSWLAQMPWLLPSDEMRVLRQSLAGIGAVRVQREGVKLFEEISLRVPLLLVIEDLHDADVSTINLVAALMERTSPARLLVIGSYRPPDALLRGGPLKTTLGRAQAAPGVTRIALDPLSRDSVHAYIQRRFQDSAVTPLLTSALEEKSGGNPLFLGELVDAMVERGWAVEDAGAWRLKVPIEEVSAMLPDSLRELIRQHFEHLDPAQIEMLEAASAVGADFTVSLVAAALARPIETVARACRDLVDHGQFISEDGERAMADGSIVEAYRFNHILYQQGLAERLKATLRRSLHRRIGEQLESEYGGRAAEVAGRLALHFELGEQREKLIGYLQMAASAANERCAFREASDFLRRMTEAVERLPETPQRAAQQASLLLIYGNLTMRVLGILNPESSAAYDAAFAAASQSGDYLLRFRAQMGRCYCTMLAGDRAVAAGLAADLVAVADAGHPELASVAHLYKSYILEGSGEFTAYLTHTEIAERMLPHAAENLPQGLSVAAIVMSERTLARLMGGVLAAGEQPWWTVAALLRDHALPWSRAHALTILARVTLMARDAEATLSIAAEAIAVTEEFGLDGLPLSSSAFACRAWAQAELGQVPVETFAAAVEQRHRDRDLWLQGYFWIVVAEMQIRNGQLEQARVSLDRAAENKTDVEWSAERERVEGELSCARVASQRSAAAPRRRRQANGLDQAAAHFQEAIRIARQQGAVLFETRARASLARLTHERKLRDGPKE